MARPQNEHRTSTPISILKSQKARLRKYAQQDVKRKGNESDAVVFERVLRFYENAHPTDAQPKPTYSKN